jgi:excisionase family DNA binding protein
MDKRVFTANEAAEELGVSSARVRQLILDGTLKTERFGRAHVITAAALEEAKLRHTKPGPVPKNPAETTRAINAAFKKNTEAARKPAKRRGRKVA